jgi:hypothetical protein
MNTPARKPRGATHGGAQPIRLQPPSRWTVKNLLLSVALVGVLEQVKVRPVEPPYERPVHT